MYKVSCFLFFSLILLLSGCSTKEEATGAAVATSSTLLITVAYANGTVIPGAEVYVNDVFKGRTNSYGEGKGTKTILLQGEKSVIKVKKESFAEAAPLSISASSAGEQKVVVLLEPVTSQVEVNVGEPGATIRLSSLKRETQLRVTDEEGKAVFEKVGEGGYTLKADKEGFSPVEQELIVEQQQANIIVPLTLSLLPHLEIEVLDNRGDPLNGVEITLYTKADFNTPGAPPYHVRLTSEGLVNFEDVVMNTTYVIIIKKEGFEAQTLEQEITPDNQFLHVVLNPA